MRALICIIIHDLSFAHSSLKQLEFKKDARARECSQEQIEVLANCYTLIPNEPKLGNRDLQLIDNATSL